MFLLRPQTRDNDDRRARKTTELSAVRLDAREWKYVAEGGANVLFRHDPPTPAVVRSEFYGKLLRVKKCDAAQDTCLKLRKRRSQSRSMRSLTGDSADDVVPTEPYNAHYPHPTKVVAYATEDVLPYLEERVVGNAYEQVAELLAVEQRFLMDLNDQLLTLEARPEHRRQSQIDVKLKCVMVLPDVTLPPPDEDPLLYFDETIESEDGSDNGATVEKERIDRGGESSTGHTTDEELFDSLADDLEAVLEDEVKTSNGINYHGTPIPTPSPSSSSSSSASTVTSGDPDLNDADVEADDAAEEEEEEQEEDLPMPRRVRKLSGNCNIFDCCFRNICVEIKPKIGFKPKGDLIADVRKRVCRFCMHQHYKRATGKVEEISEYCPLDLFSRDAGRIRRALRALQRTPQNNFKVFVRSNNDEVVNVITGLGADALPKGVAQTKYSCRRKRMGFRHSCQSIGTENDLHLQDDSDRLLPDVVELLTDVLLKLHILEDLKKIQLLDHISVDGMWHLDKLLKRVQQIANGDKEILLGDVVASLYKEIPSGDNASEDDQLREGSLARCLAFLRLAMDEVRDLDVVQGLLSWEQMPLGDFQSFYDQLLQRFQVATTLKDCSLLLCLRRDVGDTQAVPPPAPLQHHPQCLTMSSSLLRPRASPVKTFDHLREYEHRVEFRDMVFNCVVAIVDLDVKSHKSVDDYYRLDDKIVEHYVRTFGEALQADTCHED